MVGLTNVSRERDTLRAQLAERDAELSKSDARLHEVAVACATAEEKLAASEARVGVLQALLAEAVNSARYHAMMLGPAERHESAKALKELAERMIDAALSQPGKGE